MREDQKEEITKSIGTLDAPHLIAKIESLGVGEDVKLYDRGISIPRVSVNDISVLQKELSTLSKAGRSFEITVDGNRINIDTIKQNAQSYSHFSSRENLFQSSLSRSGERNNPWGITEEKAELPYMPRGSRVLDVGSGRGVIAERIKNEFECEVYALEPSFERKTDYDECVKRLGSDRVEKLTLQEALAKHPEKYLQAFDVVVVFKYNVPYLYKEEFINGLAKAVKANGVVYVTSVEPERFKYDSYHGQAVNLTEMLQKYFGSVIFSERRSFHGADGLMTCTAPRPELNSSPTNTNLAR